MSLQLRATWNTNRKQDPNGGYEVTTVFIPRCVGKNKSTTNPHNIWVRRGSSLGNLPWRIYNFVFCLSRSLSRYPWRCWSDRRHSWIPHCVFWASPSQFWRRFDRILWREERSAISCKAGSKDEEDSSEMPLFRYAVENQTFGGFVFFFYSIYLLYPHPKKAAAFLDDNLLKDYHKSELFWARDCYSIDAIVSGGL